MTEVTQDDLLALRRDLTVEIMAANRAVMSLLSLLVWMAVFFVIGKVLSRIHFSLE